MALTWQPARKQRPLAYKNIELKPPSKENDLEIQFFLRVSDKNPVQLTPGPQLPGTRAQPAQSNPTCRRPAPYSTRWRWPPGRSIRPAAFSCSLFWDYCFFAFLENQPFFLKKGIHMGKFGKTETKKNSCVKLFFFCM